MSKAIQHAREALSHLESEAHHLGMRSEYRHELAHQIRAGLDEAARLQSEVERLQGRCGELEARAVDYLKSAPGLSDHESRIAARIALEDAINKAPAPETASSGE